MSIPPQTIATTTNINDMSIKNLRMLSPVLIRSQTVQFDWQETRPWARETWGISIKEKNTDEIMVVIGFIATLG